MTSITWAGPRYVQELGTFLGSQTRTQRRCDMYVPEEVKMYSLIKLVFECIFERWEKELVLHINFKKRKIFVSNEKYVTSKIFLGETKMINISCTIVFCEVLRHCRIQSVLVKSETEIHTHTLMVD